MTWRKLVSTIDIFCSCELSRPLFYNLELYFNFRCYIPVFTQEIMEYLYED